MAIDREALYKRAGGRCECEMRVCSHHTGRCFKPLVGSKWDAHHKVKGGSDDPGNLTAMCEACHKNTRTYGQPNH